MFAWKAAAFATAPATMVAALAAAHHFAGKAIVAGD
jgi:hypothetical protein